MADASTLYYAVLFSSVRAEGDNGYATMAEKMAGLVSRQEGFLGYESYRNADGKGVTISYWKDLESIKKWKQNEEHLLAQQGGREKWYASYRVRVCRVEREYGFGKEVS